MRRLAYAIGALVVGASAGYLFTHLYRWEWQRALLAGVLLVAAELALAAGVLLDRLGGLERHLRRSPPQPDRPPPDRDRPDLPRPQQTAPPPGTPLRADTRPAPPPRHRWQRAAGLPMVGQGRYRVLPRPAPGPIATRRLQGCLQDATTDRIQLQAVTVAGIGQPAATAPPPPSVATGPARGADR